MIKPVEKFDAYSGQNGIVLNWSKSVGANKYDIYRKSDKDNKYKLIKTTGNVTSYADVNVKSGIGYTYYIVSANSKEKSKPSKEDYEYYVATPIVTFANNNLDNGIFIKWDKINGADSYRIIRHSGLKSEIINTVKELYYLDKNVKHAVEYTYSIQAIHSAKGITYSSAHPKYKTYFIAKPTGVKVTSNGKAVTVSWDLDTKMSGQNIHWSTDKTFPKENRTSIMVENVKDKTKTFNVSTGTIYVRTQKYLYKNGKRYWGAFSNVYTLKISVSNKITTKRSTIPKKNSGASYSVKLNTINGVNTFKCWTQGGFGTSEAGKWLRYHGCGVCAFMTATQPFIKKFSNMTPKSFYDTYLSKKRFGAISQSGSIGYGIMSTILKEEGLKGVVVQKYSVESAVKDIKAHLLTGQPIVITVRSQSFGGNNKVDKKYTDYAHFITLLGMTEDGYVIAADSSKHLWSVDGTSQVRFKIGNLKDIVEHTKSFSNPSSVSNWYSNTGSNGYIKIYTKR